MVVKKFTVKKKKDGFLYDPKLNCYFSWGFDIYLNGKRLQERGFLSKTLAENAVAAAKIKEKQIRFGLKTELSAFLIQLFQKKLDSLEPGRERTFQKRVYEFFLSILPENIRITELRTAHLQMYVQARQKQNHTQRDKKIELSTIDREITAILACLNNGYLFYPELETWRPPRKPPLKIQKQPRSKTISQIERNKIFGYLFQPKLETERVYQFEARRRTGLFLQFCLLTASRPGEVAKLKKQDIDFDAGIVRIYGTKTKYKSEKFVREIKLTETMERILRERIETNKKKETEFVFCNGGAITWKMRQCLRTACETFDIPYGKYTSDGIIFHTARHTSTTEMVSSRQVDTKTAGAFTGHSDEKMTLYYTHTDEGLLKKAGEVLEEKFGGLFDDGEFLPEKQKTRLQ